MISDGFIPGAASAEPSPRELRNRHIALRAAREGIVLLKNEGHLLPLSTAKPLALFGSGAVCTVKGGTGSGDVNERECVSIADGLRYTGFRLTSQSWLEDYKALYTASRQKWKEDILAHTNGDDLDLFESYSARPFHVPAGRPIEERDMDAGTDTAIYVLSRVAGENKDRELVPGDYYLSDEEHQHLTTLAGHYANLILVINTGSATDLSILDELPQIKAVLYIAQLGMEGGAALADVIHGAINPSGKLTATWALNYEDYPNAATFSYCNGDVTREEYREGIYMGYRYFDTFHIPVRFGFGHGLSYTSFSLTCDRLAVVNGTVSADVTVTNTGTRPGKEVAQLYAACPQTELDKERRRLCAWGKTQELLPGQSQTLTLRFLSEALASYSGVHSGSVLEQGIYGLYLGSSLDSAVLVGGLELKETLVLRTFRHIAPEHPLEELHHDGAQDYRHMLEQLEGLPIIPFQAQAAHPAAPSPRHYKTAVSALQILTPEEKIHLVVGRHPETGEASHLGAASKSVPGAAGETRPIGQRIPAAILADGPAGLRLTRSFPMGSDGKPRSLGMASSIEGGFFLEESPEDAAADHRYQFCTAFPVGTALAQSWNEALLFDVGQAVAEEMREFAVDLWLAPGINLHRNPLCGRNFEYYSEDPLLSGRMATAITLGVQTLAGAGVTVKHFACNNQEDNRMGSDSVVSERALRELYLRNFEIVVRFANPKAVMTSYNLVNGVHAANSPELCTWVLRDEWHFQGFVMTDWTTTSKQGGSLPWKCIAAGNDMIMPGTPEDVDNLRSALSQGLLSMQQLDLSCLRILDVVLPY